MNIFQWLKKQDYEYTWNVKIGTKIPDIIAFKDKEIVIFEIKRYANEILKAVERCLFYLKKANKVFIILPNKEIARIQPLELELLKKYGIGLIKSNNNIKVLFEPKFYPYYDEKFIKILKNKSLSETSNRRFKSIENEIVDILKKHPEGLTITEISRLLMMHRHTTIKYIYRLIGSELLFQRKVGPAKLCYLKKEISC